MTSPLTAESLFLAFAANGISYFCGVPDSTLAPLTLYLEDHHSNHDSAANEGNAIGLAAGYYLATAKPALVYMQNSGLGNALDPLASLADRSVMGIPMVLLIGWRGQPGKPDEPQHRKQGQITCDLLNLLGIPYEILLPKPEQAAKQVATAVEKAVSSLGPRALLVEGETLTEYKKSGPFQGKSKLSREEAIGIVAESLGKMDVAVTTNGKIGRELFAYRERNRQSHDQDVLVVGAMGQSSSVALAMAEQLSERQVVCFDGDGSVLMQMGSLALNGQKGLKNFYHVVFNNGVHDSTGGQATLGHVINLASVAKAVGYNVFETVNEAGTLRSTMQKALKNEGPVFLEVVVRPGASPDLIRPSITPAENKRAILDLLKLPNQ